MIGQMCSMIGYERLLYWRVATPSMDLLDVPMVQKPNRRVWTGTEGCNRVGCSTLNLFGSPEKESATSSPHTEERWTNEAVLVLVLVICSNQITISLLSCLVVEGHV
jgi:hypothetical protein